LLRIPNRISSSDRGGPNPFKLDQTFPWQAGATWEAQGPPDRGWILIQLPAALDRAVVQSVLDAARELIAEADAAEQAPQAAQTEAVIGEWARQRG
jgi:hypothetical protein